MTAYLKATQWYEVAGGINGHIRTAISDLVRGLEGAGVAVSFGPETGGNFEGDINNALVAYICTGGDSAVDLEVHIDTEGYAEVVYGPTIGPADAVKLLVPLHREEG